VPNSVSEFTKRNLSLAVSLSFTLALMTCSGDRAPNRVLPPPPTEQQATQACFEAARSIYDMHCSEVIEVESRLVVGNQYCYHITAQCDVGDRDFMLEYHLDEQQESWILRKAVDLTIAVEPVPSKTEPSAPDHRE